MTTKVIQIKMSEEQRKVILRYANKVGLAPTTFMRFIVLDFIQKQKKEEDKSQYGG